MAHTEMRVDELPIQRLHHRFACWSRRCVGFERRGDGSVRSASVIAAIGFKTRQYATRALPTL